MDLFFISTSFYNARLNFFENPERFHIRTVNFKFVFIGIFRIVVMLVQKVPYHFTAFLSNVSMQIGDTAEKAL